MAAGAALLQLSVVLLCHAQQDINIQLDNNGNAGYPAVPRTAAAAFFTFTRSVKKRCCLFIYCCAWFCCAAANGSRISIVKKKADSY
jgi:hypothetical protein